MASPLRLTDNQLSAVLSAAQPLAQNVREDFLEALAARLQQCSELGDGLVFRIIREVQAEFWEPPRDTHVNLSPQTSNAAKWRSACDRKPSSRSVAE